MEVCSFEVHAPTVYVRLIFFNKPTAKPTPISTCCFWWPWQFCPVLQNTNLTQGASLILVLSPNAQGTLNMTPILILWSSLRVKEWTLYKLIWTLGIVCCFSNCHLPAIPISRTLISSWRIWTPRSSQGLNPILKFIIVSWMVRHRKYVHLVPIYHSIHRDNTATKFSPLWSKPCQTIARHLWPPSQDSGEWVECPGKLLLPLTVNSVDDAFNRPR